MLNNLAVNYEEAVAMILFGIGFCTLLFHRNLVKKIIGLNIMDTAVYLFLASMGYIVGRRSPLGHPSVPASVSAVLKTLTSGVVGSGGLVSVSVTAIMLALTIKLYKRYHTLNLDEIYMFAKNEDIG